MANLTRIQLKFEVFYFNWVKKELKEIIWWNFWKFGYVQQLSSAQLAQLTKFTTLSTRVESREG